MLNPSRIRSDYRECFYSEPVTTKYTTQFWAKPAALMLCGFLLGVFLHGTTLLAKDHKSSSRVESSQKVKP